MGSAGDQAAAVEARLRPPLRALGVGRGRGSVGRGAGASERHRGHARRHGGCVGGWKGMVAVAAVAVVAVVAVYSQPQPEIRFRTPPGLLLGCGSTRFRTWSGA